jgi:hypothetical protein
VRLGVDRTVAAPDGDRPPLRRPDEHTFGKCLPPDLLVTQTLRQSVRAPWVPSEYASIA